MAEFTKIIAIRNRMCHKINSCPECPLYAENTGYSCRECVFRDPEEYERILLKWDAENPIKTNADIFKEVFDVGISPTGCNGFDCPYNESCETCQLKDFWEQEYKENNHGGNDQYT